MLRAKHKVLLEEKVAIVTGAGRGLGRASSIEMAREGANLVIASRTVSELRETESVIRSLGQEVIYLKTDVSKLKGIKKVVDRAIERFGRVDILMNNAAIIGPIRPIFQVEEERWNEVLNIKLRGPYLFSKVVIPFMINQGRGKIINVTSGLGEMVMPLFGAYSITKAGLIHLTKILSEELKDYNIQVNGLDPGVMDTKMQDEVRNLGPKVLGKEIYSEFLSLKERGLLKPPEQVARLAVFLASEKSDSITGENGTESYYSRFGYKK